MSNDDDEFSGVLGIALRERVSDSYPDFDHLIASSLRQGTRLRKRRRAGFALAIAASVAGIGVAGVLLLPTAQRADKVPDYASSPRPTDTSSCALIDDTRSPDSDAGYGTESPQEAAAPEVIDLPHSSPELLRSDPAGLACRNGPVGDIPVRLDLPGWTCEPPIRRVEGPSHWMLTCTDSDRRVTITVRDAAERETWIAAADRHSAFASEVHGEFFATIVIANPYQVPNLDFDLAAIDAGLIWK
ncbi:MAG: hypothetical protein HZY75_10630 [Nocardioidaceae bacterium]|nr:MAG: hypothetical protein HZY75_10630 [Nocardioidaceae bacterium]